MKVQNSAVMAGTFYGADIEPGTFHGTKSVPGTFQFLDVPSPLPATLAGGLVTHVATDEKPDEEQEDGSNSLEPAESDC